MKDSFKHFDTLKKEISILIKNKKFDQILNTLDSFEKMNLTTNSDNKNHEDIIIENREFRLEKVIFKSLLDLTPTGICIVTSHKHLFVNKAWQEITGYSEKEAFDMSLIEIVHPDMKEMVKQRSDSRLIGEKVLKRYDIKIIAKDKSIKWIDISFSLIQFENQKASLGIFNDITEIKNTREALIKGEEKYKNIFDSMIDVFYRLNAEGVVEIVSPSVFHVFGYKPEEVIGKSILDFYINKDKGFGFLEEILKKEEIEQNEESFISKAGEEIVLSTNAKSLKDSAGNFIGVEGIARDITEQKKAEIEIRKSEEKFRKLSDLSPSGISIQRKNKYFYVNKAWSEIMGYDVDEIEKIGPFDIIHPEMHEFAWKSSDENLRKEGAKLRYDLKIITKDKKEKWLDVSIATIKFNDQYATLAISNDITDIYKTRETLKLSEEKFRKLTELSPAAICIQTTKKFLWVNPAWSEISGYPHDEVLKMNPLDIIHPDMREIAKERSDARLNNKDVISRYNLKIITKDKKVKWVDIAVTLIQFDGQTAFLAVSSDITKQVEAQQALKENEEKYRSIIENLRHEYFFYRHNTYGVFEYVSPSIEHILGYKQEDFLTHYAKYLSKNPVNKIAVEKFELAMQGIQQLPYELEIFDIQKNIHTLEISEAPIIDNYGNVITVEGIAHDITSQKKAEKLIKAQLKEIQIHNEEIKSVNEEINAVNDDLERRIEDINRLNIDLKISENKFRTLVRNIPGVVYRCLNDKKWTMLFISNEVEILTGYAASDFIENSVKTFASIIHPDDIERVEESIKCGVEKRKSYVIEYRIFHKDGRVKWVYEKGQYILEERSGDIQFLDGVIIDITEKKKAEEKLKESENKLRELNTQKDKFFSLIAHDLRSPIGNFLQISELLKMRYDEMPKDEIFGFFDHLHNLADKTYKLLENLLMWSRSQLGRLESNLEELNLHNIVKDIAYLYEESLIAKSIKLNNEIPTDFTINADLNVVQTVFRNIINNAIKFSFQGGTITVQSKLELIDNVEFVIVSVKDKGVGIPEDVVNTIFDIDVDYTTPGTANEKGTGLGLILCKELIEKNGGKMWVGSENGKGSTFCFTLKR